MQELQNVYWYRTKRAADAAPLQKKARARQDRAERLRVLCEGLVYVALFCAAMFLEVYLQAGLKAYSLDVWMLSRKKVEVESEITRLDMRLTVLESPLRIESLAASEIGLTAAVPQNKTPAKD